MKLEILGASVGFKPYGHNINPEVLVVGEFDLCLGGREMKFNFDKQVKYFQDLEDSFGLKVKTVGGAKFWQICDNVSEKRFTNIMNTSKDILPEINCINRIGYKAYTDKADYDLELASLSFNVIDYDSKELFEIVASEEIINDYNKNKNKIHKLESTVYIHALNKDFIDIRLTTSPIIYKVDDEQITSTELILEMNDGNNIDDLCIQFVECREGYDNAYDELNSVELVNVAMTKEEFKKQCKQIVMEAIISKARDLNIR